MAVIDEAQIALLGHVALFDGCTHAELAEVAGLMEEYSVDEPGAVLTAQDYPGKDAFVIIEGVARVERDGQRLADLGEGDFFGEISLLDGGPRTADVVSESPMIVLVLSRGQLEKLVTKVSPVALAMLREMAARVRRLDKALS